MLVRYAVEAASDGKFLLQLSLCVCLRILYNALGLRFSFFFSFQMALDGKAIKEEIPDKDAYDARKVKGKCRTDFFLLCICSVTLYW